MVTGNPALELGRFGALADDAFEEAVKQGRETVFKRALGVVTLVGRQQRIELLKQLGESALPFALFGRREKLLHDFAELLERAVDLGEVLVEAVAFDGEDQFTRQEANAEPFWSCAYSSSRVLEKSSAILSPELVVI